MTDDEMQKQINQEIQEWKVSGKNEPLVIEFEDGEKFVFVKTAA